MTWRWYLEHRPWMPIPKFWPKPILTISFPVPNFAENEIFSETKFSEMETLKTSHESLASSRLQAISYICFMVVCRLSVCDLICRVHEYSSKLVWSPSPLWFTTTRLINFPPRLLLSDPLRLLCKSENVIHWLPTNGHFNFKSFCQKRAQRWGLNKVNLCQYDRGNFVSLPFVNE